MTTACTTKRVLVFFTNIDRTKFQRFHLPENISRYARTSELRRHGIWSFDFASLDFETIQYKIPAVFWGLAVSQPKRQKSKPDWSVCCWTLGLPNRFCCPKTEEIGGYDQHQYRKQVQQSEPRYNSQDTRLINVVIIKRIGLIIRCSWSTLAN